MKIIWILFCFLSPSWAQSSPQCPTDRPDYFCITPEMSPESLIDFVTFYSIPNQILTLFQVELATKNFPLILNADWKSPYFGAGVSLFESQFKLMILGGTTRISGLTKDAYAAIVCHELGHILGGAPYQTIPFAEWSSSEGQADFFAASECLPRYFREQNEIEANIPLRIEQSGFEMVHAISGVFNDGQAPLRFQRDFSQAPQTLINNYPTYQCRYENFRAPTSRPECWFKN